MNSTFDPRTWNIVAGVALLAAGCSSRVIGQDDGEIADADTGSDTGADTGPDTDTGDDTDPGTDNDTGTECQTSSDCNFGYECLAGVCEYYGYQDGWIPYYECYSDEECGDFRICDFGYCVGDESPPPDCPDMGGGDFIPLQVEGDVLALQFADADGDGRAELVVATATQFQVFDDVFAPPTITQREPAAGELLDMVAGDFDGIPGQDLLLLIGGSAVLHSSNGDGSFAPGVPSLPGVTGATGLLAGNFDDQSPTDVLAWGGDSALVVRGDDTLEIGVAGVNAVAAFEFGVAGSGFALRSGSVLDLYRLDGTYVTDLAELGTSPPTVAAFTAGPAPRYATVVPYGSWSRVVTYYGDSGSAAQSWPISGMPQRILAGDLDGDDADELVFLDSSNLGIQYDPLGPGNCWSGYPFGAGATGALAALGDHDGDGDDELVVRHGTDTYYFFDGG